MAAAEPDPRGRSAAAYAQPHGAESRAVGEGDGGAARRLQGSGRAARRSARRPPAGRRDRRHRRGLSAQRVSRGGRAGPEGLENLLPYGAMVVQRLRAAQRAFRGLDGGGGARSSPGSTRNAPARRCRPMASARSIWAAVDAGEISAEEAPLLVRSLLSAGLDTTIIGIGNALYAFAANPSQWQALRENPALRSAGLRRDAALGIAGADVLPHHDARGRTRRRRTAAGREILLFLASAPIAIRAAGRTRTASTSPARPPGTSPSAPASICASARCWRGSRPK